MKKILFIVLSILLIGCSSNNTNEETKNENNKQQETNKETDMIQPEGFNGDYPVVTITMKDGNVIEMELYPDKAPNTVANFISLINDGFYDGTVFHRIIPGFVIQGGDPLGNGTGGPGYSIKGEFINNKFNNDLKHTQGIVSMARSSSYDSAGSQFFIVLDEASWLDNEYAGFGKVINGMDYVLEIASTETDNNDMPLQEVVMEKVTVDTKGIEYNKPVIIE